MWTLPAATTVTTRFFLVDGSGSAVAGDLIVATDHDGYGTPLYDSALTAEGGNMKKSAIATSGMFVAAAMLAVLVPARVAAAATAGLSVNLTVSPPSGLGPGGNVTYTATIANNGPDAATTVSFTAAMPAGIIPISATPDGSCAFSFDGGTVNCSLGTIANGANKMVVMVVHPVTTGTKTITGQASATEVDPNPGDNTASANSSITEVGISEMQVQLFDVPDPLRVGQPLFYVASVRNNGDDGASDVVVDFTLPAGAVFIAAASDRGACSVSGRRVTCPLGGFDVGATSFAFVEVVPLTPGFLWANVGLSLTTPDPNITNNSASARTWVNP
jgi:uncharacterized repeat protein (TIGR01451 family)